MSKPWHDYPDQFRSAVIRAYKAGRSDVIFTDPEPDRARSAAYSFRTRAVWMQKDVAAQEGAPQDLRFACASVRWEGPKLSEFGAWVLTGTTAPRPGLTDADVIGAMRGGE